MHGPDGGHAACCFHPLLLRPPPPTHPPTPTHPRCMQCVSLGHIAETDSDAVARPKLEAKKAEAGVRAARPVNAMRLAFVYMPCLQRWARAGLGQGSRGLPACAAAQPRVGAHPPNEAMPPSCPPPPPRRPTAASHCAAPLCLCPNTRPWASRWQSAGTPAPPLQRPDKAVSPPLPPPPAGLPRQSTGGRLPGAHRRPRRRQAGLLRPLYRRPHHLHRPARPGGTPSQSGCGWVGVGGWVGGGGGRCAWLGGHQTSCSRYCCCCGREAREVRPSLSGATCRRMRDQVGFWGCVCAAALGLTQQLLLASVAAALPCATSDDSGFARAPAVRNMRRRWASAAASADTWH